VLLHLFSTSHFFTDLLSLNPANLDMLRVPLRRSPKPGRAAGQLQAAVDCRADDPALLRAFAASPAAILRIGTNDIIRDRPLEEITQDLSRVADAALEVPCPRPAPGQPALWPALPRHTARRRAASSWPSQARRRGAELQAATST